MPVGQASLPAALAAALTEACRRKCAARSPHPALLPQTASSEHNRTNVPPPPPCRPLGWAAAAASGSRVCAAAAASLPLPHPGAAYLFSQPGSPFPIRVIGAAPLFHPCNTSRHPTGGGLPSLHSRFHATHSAVGFPPLRRGVLSCRVGASPARPPGQFFWSLGGILML